MAKNQNATKPASENAGEAKDQASPAPEAPSEAADRVKALTERLEQAQSELKAEQEASAKALEAAKTAEETNSKLTADLEAANKALEAAKTAGGSAAAPANDDVRVHRLRITRQITVGGYRTPEGSVVELHLPTRMPIASFVGLYNQGLVDRA